MKSSPQTDHSISGVFIFLLLSIFAVFSMIMVLLGVRAYRSAQERSEATNEYRLLSSYIRSMVRQEDGFAAIYMEETEGLPVLVMEEVYEDEVYYNRIYCQGGKLRNWFSGAEYAFVPDQGDVICDAQDFQAEVKDGLLSVRLQNPQGDWVESEIALYAGGERRAAS